MVEKASMCEQLKVNQDELLLLLENALCRFEHEHRIVPSCEPLDLLLCLVSFLVSFIL